jgi:hypothetical protein
MVVVEFGGICLTYLVNPKLLLTLKFGSICLTKLLNPKYGSPLKLPKASDTHNFFFGFGKSVFEDSSFEVSGLTPILTFPAKLS